MIEAQRRAGQAFAGRIEKLTLPGNGPFPGRAFPIAVITSDADARFAEIRALYEWTPSLHLPPEYPLT